MRLLYLLSIVLLSCFNNKAIAQSSTQQNMQFHQELSKRTGPIHLLWDELLQKHVSDDGNVNYKSFQTEHKKLLGYIKVLGLFHSNDIFQTISREEKLAFWINAYNALTVDLIIRNYPVKSIKDIKNPWKQRLWKPANFEYNLDEIEHEILRNMDEPRIHFAIVCASYSCPKLQNKAFTSEKLDLQLTKATKEFLADTNRNEISKNNIKISKIFDWFSKDFTKNGSLIDFLNQYSEVNISPNAKKRYKDYNWDLND
ncbi:DUF547 domain-containing protein [Flavobacteriaceae bacterium S0825]|uniref:DUF547 domain-containing protein n=1 Tax=Gaetbulibacter sp. S0825 TaxID=2720084 RepID=UPI00143040F8|nr:DUF547 domain-containing protein [Gaetbulibacter sp. S0825]MCK0107773.1 DUF547 domain-containing protein [Flavobacteriaceae bacterium S0825]NIX63409.1 DUF547 domain-containing protein [Gaetbulibacter sp. S0825]